MFEFPLQEVEDKKSSRAGDKGGILMKRDATLRLRRRNSCRIPAGLVEVKAGILSSHGESFPGGFAACAAGRRLHTSPPNHSENQICECLLWVVCHVFDLLPVDSEELLDISNAIVGLPAAAVRLTMKHLLLLSTY